MNQRIFDKLVKIMKTHLMGSSLNKEQMLELRMMINVHCNESRWGDVTWERLKEIYQSATECFVANPHVQKYVTYIDGEHLEILRTR